LKKVKLVLISLLTIILTVNTSLSIDFNLDKLDSADKPVQLNTKLHENQEIKESFNKIADRPYDVQKYNCKHKSESFANALVKKSASNVYLVTIEHLSGEYSHMVVLWDNKVYDATIKPPVYGMEGNYYFNKVKKYGFNGLRITTPYTGN
jgi:uncharacterized protein YxeA